MKTSMPLCLMCKKCANTDNWPSCVCEFSLKGGCVEEFFFACLSMILEQKIYVCIRVCRRCLKGVCVQVFFCACRCFPVLIFVTRGILMCFRVFERSLVASTVCCSRNSPAFEKPSRRGRLHSSSVNTLRKLCQKSTQRYVSVTLAGRNSFPCHSLVTVSSFCGRCSVLNSASSLLYLGSPTPPYHPGRS